MSSTSNPGRINSTLRKFLDNEASGGLVLMAVALLAIIKANSPLAESYFHNGDMHLKNWSLIYPDKQTPAISPAYDLLSTISYIEGEDTAALNFSRTKKMAALSLDELAHLAAKAELSEKLVLDTARETVERFRAVWDAEKANLPMAAKVREMIDAHAPTIELYRECT